MTNAHTSGPWEAIQEGDGTRRIMGPVYGQHFRNEIAELSYSGGHAEANARLIAAAPELLETLRKIADREWTGTGAEHGARHAIAKVTGADYGELPEEWRSDFELEPRD